jgi:hypothetical protein
MVTMSAGRDYRTGSRYEYCVFDDEKVVAREGYFTSNAAAKRAGLKAAQAYIEAYPASPAIGE